MWNLSTAVGCCFELLCILVRPKEEEPQLWWRHLCTSKFSTAQMTSQLAVTSPPCHGAKMKHTYNVSTNFWVYHCLSSVLPHQTSNPGVVSSNPTGGQSKIDLKKILPWRILIFSDFEPLGGLLWCLDGYLLWELRFIKIHFGVLWALKFYYTEGWARFLVKVKKTETKHSQDENAYPRGQ